MSKSEKKLNTGFYEIFKEKLVKQKEELKRELKLAKSERRREWLKSQLKQAKSMRDLLKEMEKQMGKLTHCPNCGEKL